MAFKFFILAALVAIARAGVVPAVTGVAYAASPLAHQVVDAHYDHNPQYTFGYDVQDPYTGDSKSQVETRTGDVVTGQYSLNDPDGTRRTVDYTADDVHGFNAVVRKDPLVAHVAAAPIVRAAPVVSAAVATPVVHHHVAAKAVPVAYHAPVAHVSHVAPYAYSPYAAYSGYSAYPQVYGLGYVNAGHYY